MRLYYPYPSIFESDPAELEKATHSLAILALNKNKDLIIVGECAHSEVWRSFWNQVGKKPLSHISIERSEQESNGIISRIAEVLIHSFQFIIANRYHFIGILEWDNNVFDNQIIEDWGLLKSRKTKRFQNMSVKFHSYNYYPELLENSYINTKIMGIGERFLDFQYVQDDKIAIMTKIYHGRLTGVIGISAASQNLDFMILTQNITKSEQEHNLILDKRGRQTLNNLIKLGSFYPAAGFQLDYGIQSLKNLPYWNSLILIPNVNLIMKEYSKYLNSIIGNVPIDLPSQNIPKPFAVETTQLLQKIFHELFPDREPLSTPIEHKQDSQNRKNLRDDQEDHQLINQQKLEKEKLKPVKIPELQKPSIALKKPSLELKKPNLDLKKPTVSKSALEKPDLSKFKQSSQIAEETKDYDDIFNKPNQQSVLKEGKMVIDQNQLDSVIDDAASMIEMDLGQAIDPKFMDEETIFKDLESSLNALSKLDALAEKDAAQMRLYYPPPTLVSYANKEGMEIGGSTCVMSMGVGRNIWAVPELRRMQMWGEFWRQEDVEGNPQIKDFIALNNNKDIDNPEQLEDILQKTFIRIRRNNQLFLGVAEFEGNGFESIVFPECELNQTILDKLADIHAHKRAEMEFPEISQDSWIELRYFGKPSIISFLANPNSQGTLEIVKEMHENILYKKGIITGIICIEEEAANFFILSDNFSNLDQDEYSYSIDEDTLNKMLDMINKLNITPVSWVKLSFGFQGFENLFLWEDIKEGIILQIVKERYDKYIDELLNMKNREDFVRLKIESDLNAVTGKIIQCPFCGTENSSKSSICIACNKQLKE